MVRKREILGIYFGEAGIEVSCLRRGAGGWSALEQTWPAPDPKQPVAEQVRAVLSAFRPSRSRVICFGLPRKALFLRELTFSQLSPDEAANSVRLGIGLYAHLEPDKILHDQWAFTRGAETVVLLAYVPKGYVQPVVDVVKETGHAKSMGPVSPASLGLDILLRRSGEAHLPCVVLGQQDGAFMLSLHGLHGWEGSHPVVPKTGEDLAKALGGMIPFLPPPFSERLLKGPAFFVGKNAPGLAPQPPDPCRAMGGLGTLCGSTGVSWGLCAAALGLSSYPLLAFQEGRRRLPLQMRVRPYQLAVGAAVIGAVLATAALGVSVEHRAHVLAGFDGQVKTLDARLAPLLEKQKGVDAYAQRYQDIVDFRKQAPPVMEIMRALAQLTPMDTWIRNFDLRNGKLRLTAEGDSAVQVMDVWRQSPLFKDVKLVSPVTKVGPKERFSVELEFAGPEGGPGHGA